jgi:hypothetical protein
MASTLKGFPIKTKSLFGRLLGRNRRQFQRFVGREITPIFIGKDTPQQGLLIDISIGGVCLEYKPGQKPLSRIFAMDFQATDGFRLGQVLLEKVSDKAVNKGDAESTHRLRAKFLNLSQVKANKLSKFLEIYQGQEQ